MATPAKRTGKSGKPKAMEILKSRAKKAAKPKPEESSNGKDGHAEPSTDVAQAAAPDVDTVEAPNTVIQRHPVKLSTQERNTYEIDLRESVLERRKIGSQYGYSVKDLKDRVDELEKQIDVAADSEEIGAGRKIAALIDQHRAAKSALEAMAGHQKAAHTEIQGKITRLTMVVNTGIEYREVSCKIVRDYRTKSVRIVREDTGEKVSERVMEEAELNMELPLS